MIAWRPAAEWRQLWRYYQAGFINTLFGYGCFALLVALGLNMYLAQIAAHIAGVTFNYFTYSRYAFGGRRASKLRFILSYLGNYVLSLACLAAFATITASPYLAGLAATLLVSAANYWVLKRLVFRSGEPAT